MQADDTPGGLHGEMRPGMLLLLLLLRRETAGEGMDEGECGEALALAEEQHLLPLAVDRLLGTGITPVLRQRLLKIKREVEIDSFYLSTELKRLMRAFEAKQLVVVPLKGPFLGERLMGDATLRVSYDLDLMVAKTDVQAAGQVLSGMGFVPGAADDYHRAWHRGGTTLELHEDVDNPLTFEFSSRDALRRVERDVFAGQSCWRLAAADELYYLCLHAARHRFERLSLVVDLCLAFETLHNVETGLRGEEGDHQQLLCLGLAMARRLKPDLKVELGGVPGATERHISKVADRLWGELLTKASEPLDWATLHSFYRELEPPGRRAGRRWRDLRIALGRVIGPDVEFAAGFGLHRRWQAQLLRPVRLLRDRAVARRSAEK